MSAQGSRLTPERAALEEKEPSAGRLWKVGYVAVAARPAVRGRSRPSSDKRPRENAGTPFVSLCFDGP